MRYGLKDRDIKAIGSVFARHRGIEKVVLYGSRAMGNYRNGSDIDLVLIGSNLSFEELLKIKGELDDLLLPYKIDLSLYSKINNEDLLEHIKRAGLTFYEREAVTLK
jgi:predicted nucleotidyltransferase